VDDKMQPDLFSIEELMSAPVAVAEPQAAQSVFIEPVFIEPVLIEPVLIEPVLIEPVLAEPVLPEPVLPEPTPRPSWSGRLAVFDLETTGIDVETSRVVTANVSVIDHNGVLESRLDWLANPGIEIPEQATAVHGVTTEKAVTEGQSAHLVVTEIVEALQALLDAGVPVVVYNAPYDLTLLDREARRNGIVPLSITGPIVDPLVIDKAVDRYREGKRTLEVSAVFYGVELLDAHDAGADAIAAGRVAQAIAERHADELSVSAAELHELQVGWFREQAESFQEYMRRVRDPEFTAKTAWPLG
jgi:DNA polymerase-3 subunit epsilon